jgi:tetratricopeptide (TPR) repeat protein
VKIGVSLDDAVVQAHERGSIRALAAALTFRSLARQRAGRPIDAVDDARAALDHAFSGQVDLDPAFAAGYLAQALLDTGDLDGAERALNAVRAFDSADPGPRYYAREAAARLRRLQGHPADALEIALDAGRVWAQYGFDNPALGAWRTEAALAAFATGERDDAVELARKELSLAETWGAPGARGRARRTLGRVLGGSDGLAHLMESVNILQNSPARLEHARSLAAHGAALRRAGRRNDAHRVLAQALDIAEICGADRLTGDITIELRSAGFRPRRHRLGGSDRSPSANDASPTSRQPATPTAPSPKRSSSQPKPSSST